MNDIDQAQGLKDWARYQQLLKKHWLSEDEGWEKATLMRDLGLLSEEEVRSEPFDLECWSGEVVRAYQEALVSYMVRKTDAEIMKLGEE